METNALKEIVTGSKVTLKLSHLGLKRFLCFFGALFATVAGLPILLIPIAGWMFYTVMVLGLWILFAEARLLYRVRDCRFKKIFIIKDDGDVVQKDYYYALTDGVEIMCIMQIVDIAKNKTLKTLLTAQYNKKNKMFSIDLTQKEFLDYHKGGVMSHVF